MNKNMTNTRGKRARLNIVVSLVCQLITLLCGFVVPRLLIGAFGSEAYGATSSIAQFLAYVTLLEGGIGGVARAALYKPLANHDIQGISEVVLEIKRFFRVIAYIFVAYVLILACTFKYISNIECFDWISTFFLVIVISISTFGQYFIGISNTILLQASQKTYITQIVSISATILNTVFVIILVTLNCNLIIVKLISSCIFVMRPIALWLYVKKHYKLVKCSGEKRNLLKQKWAGLGQHIAYFLHSNTDVAVLTVFANLTVVAVYSVYNMVVSQIQNLTSSFSSGMEALFGDMLAKKEYGQLYKSFGYYETLISIISIVLFSTTAVLIVPFIRLYTAGITDADYDVPTFALLLIISSAVYCLRMPYHAITIAAGHFKQTQMAAYGEAVINIGLSIILVTRYNLIGVAIGTLIATTFRFIFYVVYLSRNIFNRSILLFVKRECINTLNFIGVFFIGKLVISQFIVSNYAQWVVCGAIVAVISVVITLWVNAAFYRPALIALFGKYLNRNKKTNSNV